MSNAIHAPGKVLSNGCAVPLCGRWTKDSVEGNEVTCRRCLASLAKRDREFQRKARRGIMAFFWTGDGTNPWVTRALTRNTRLLMAIDARRDAARAIAREEGRAP